MPVVNESETDARTPNRCVAPVFLTRASFSRVRAAVLDGAAAAAPLSVAPVAPAKTLAAPRAAPAALGALKAPSATKSMGALFLGLSLIHI